MGKFLGCLALFTSLVLSSATIFPTDLPYKIPTISCPPGYDMKDKTCTRVTETDFLMACPTGTTLSDASCISVQEFEGEVACPPGSTRVGGLKKCVGVESAAAEISCLSGFALKGNKCSRILHYNVSLYCHQGYQLSKEGVCYKRTGLTVDLSCPEGFSAESDGCAAYEKADSVASCRHGYVLERGECVSRRDFKPKLFCKNGYKRGKCVRVDIVPASLACKKGQLVGHMCVYIAHRTCRKGITANGKCTNVLEEEIQLTCGNGFHLEGKICVSKTALKPELACQEGFELSHGRCVAVRTGTVQAIYEAGCEMADGKCVSKIVEPAVTSCPSGFTNSDTDCKKVVYAKKLCPRGSFSEDSNCVVYQTQAAVPVCKRGQMGADGKCVDAQESEKLVSCQKGFRINADNGNCEKQVYKDAEVECSEGAPRGDRCVKAVVKPPILSCPRGFTMKEQACSKIDVVNGVDKCPKGYKLIKELCISIFPQDKPAAFRHRSGKLTPVKFKSLGSSLSKDA